VRINVSNSPSLQPLRAVSAER